MRQFILYLIFSSHLICQDKVWVQLENGYAQFLNPYENDWVPINSKELIPSKTYLITHPHSQTIIYKETEQFLIPEDSYVFIDDIFKIKKMDIVAALVQIDTEQLPNRQNNNKLKPIFGITYGTNQVKQRPIISKEIKQRFNSINYFEEKGKLGAAVLSLRRLILKYPEFGFEPNTTLRLLNLYIELKLDGYAYELSNQFIHKLKKEEVPKDIIELNRAIKLRLTKSNR